MNFNELVKIIEQVHSEMTSQARRAVNTSLTLRNWMIGFYIAEYELRGADRASYGECLLKRLADELTKAEVSSCGKRQLYNYLKFFHIYSQIVRAVTAQLENIFPHLFLPSGEIVQSVTAFSKLDPQQMLNSLSYTHFEQLFVIDDDTKRAFYEIECIQGSWSVRELKRQINSLYYERSGLSY